MTHSSPDPRESLCSMSNTIEEQCRREANIKRMSNAIAQVWECEHITGLPTRSADPDFATDGVRSSTSGNPPGKALPGKKATASKAEPLMQNSESRICNRFHSRTSSDVNLPTEESIKKRAHHDDHGTGSASSSNKSTRARATEGQVSRSRPFFPFVTQRGRPPETTRAAETSERSG